MGVSIAAALLSVQADCIVYCVCCSELHVVCRSKQRQPATDIRIKKASLSLTSVVQLFGLVLVTAPHLQTLHHLNNAYGPSCIILAPATVWCIPWACGMLLWLRYRYDITSRHKKLS